MAEAQEYHVEFEIEVMATSPTDAVREVAGMLSDGLAGRAVYTVRRHAVVGATTETIDLEELASVAPSNVASWPL